jgi:hypothetical protein
MPHWGKYGFSDVLEIQQTTNAKNTKIEDVVPHNFVTFVTSWSKTDGIASLGQVWL